MERLHPCKPNTFQARLTAESNKHLCPQLFPMEDKGPDGFEIVAVSLERLESFRIMWSKFFQ